MTNMLPKACIDKIHNFVGEFNLGDTIKISKYHAINWDTITKHK